MFNYLSGQLFTSLSNKLCNLLKPSVFTDAACQRRIHPVLWRQSPASPMRQTDTKPGRDNMRPEERVSPLKNFIAGGIGGACLLLAGHPLDTIKVTEHWARACISEQDPGFECLLWL